MSVRVSPYRHATSRDVGGGRTRPCPGGSLLPRSREWPSWARRLRHRPGRPSYASSRLLSHQLAEFILQILQPTIAPVSVHFRPQRRERAALPRIGPDTPGGFGLGQKVDRHPHQVMGVQLEVDESIQVRIADFLPPHGVLPCSSARRRQTSDSVAGCAQPRCIHWGIDADHPGPQAIHTAFT